jgi:DNA polymerase-3 subunit alpha
MPKIISKTMVKPSTMSEDEAADLFDKIEVFAGYGFNKSHSCTYSMISYQCMYLKTKYPIEFIAAALSIMKEDKLPELLREANRLGVTIELPDVNLASDTFEILNDTRLMIPLARIKGLSDAAAKEIVEKRNKGGKFTSMADFETRCRSRMVHKGKIESLSLVGAFAAIEPTHLPSDSPTRIKDQRDLIPGLIVSNVPINRVMEIDTGERTRLSKLQNVMKNAVVADGIPVKPAIGKNARFMVIFDCPSKQEEERNNMMLASDSFCPYALERVFEALGDADMSITDAYWTSLVKRPKAGKSVSPEEVKLYAPYINKELEILKPPAIVLMGAATVRAFLPDFKGKASDQAGEVIYHKGLDTNLVIGFSPGEIYHDPSKQETLAKVFAVAGDLTV